jgi:hypothetical protein
MELGQVFEMVYLEVQIHNQQLVGTVTTVLRHVYCALKCADPPHTENPIYVFSEMKLRGLVPNSYIHVSVCDLNIPRIPLPIWQTDPGNI